MNTMRWAFEKAYQKKAIQLTSESGIIIGNALKSVYERII